MSRGKGKASVTYLRFVTGFDADNPYWLDGIFTAAESLRVEGCFYRHENVLLSETFQWFNAHLPCPPFRRKFRSGEWSRDAVCWFHPEAGEPIRRIWDLVAVLQEHGAPVRVIKALKPGRIVYEDRFQVVAETPRWA